MTWLRGLGDGYILFDRADLFAKVEGPLVVEEVTTRAGPAGLCADPQGLAARPAGPRRVSCAPRPLRAAQAILRRPAGSGRRARAKPEIAEFAWHEPENAPLKRTRLYDWHRAHTKHIVPFAGWEMPVWYTGVLDEHNAVRRAAGLFDVSHMGVFEASGPHAEEFLDLVLTNYVRWYAPGESFYAYLLDAGGKVIDDLLVYRRGQGAVPDRGQRVQRGQGLGLAERGQQRRGADRPRAARPAGAAAGDPPQPEGPVQRRRHAH